MIQGFKAIAYTDDSKIVTKTLVNLNCIRQLRKLSKTYILFLHNTMVVVLLNWQIYSCIHHVENFGEKITATTHKSMSLAEAAQLYNLTLKFEAVHYISGDNDTEENAYLN